MRVNKTMRRWGASWVLALAVALYCPAPAAAQGCAQCKANAEAAAPAARRALNRGIVMLAVPAVAIMAGFALAAYRMRSSPEK